MGGKEIQVRADNCLAQRHLFRVRGQPVGCLKDFGKVIRVLPGNEVAIGGQCHGFAELDGRRVRGDISLLDTAEAAGGGEADGGVDLAGVVERE